MVLRNKIFLIKVKDFFVSVRIIFLRVPCWLSGKESTANAGERSLILGLGRPPGEGNGNPLQYFWVGNPTDRGAWQAIVHRGHKKSDTTKAT